MQPWRRPERSEGRRRGCIHQAAARGGDCQPFVSSPSLAAPCYSLEKKQIIHRLPVSFVLRIIEDFNAGKLDAAAATFQLGIRRSRLYEIRSAWLKDKKAFQPGPSGGVRRLDWPTEINSFLVDFLPLQNPPNYQLVCDEMVRLHSFKRARSTLSDHVQKHFSHLVPPALHMPRIYRRFRRAHIGELWQHDSSIHQWWPAEDKQVLLLTLDDHSGLNLAGRFVQADTTWNHFCHFRQAFELWGIPEIIYTDGLSLFGPSSSDDYSDPRSEFQRALKALGIVHLVAPTPQAKGKIERRFGTFQRRLVILLAHAKAQNFDDANQVLQMEIDRQNRTHSRSTQSIPIDAWNSQIRRDSSRMRPAPASSLLDLHFSLRQQRRVNLDQTIDFNGQNYQITPTPKKYATVVLHPNHQFWVVQHPPTSIWPPILGRFSL